jgi:hypothetical protein
MSRPPRLPVKSAKKARLHSDVRGLGYGSAHSWEQMECAQVGSAPPHMKWARYKCRSCQAQFRHYYDVESDIFITMDVLGVPENCKATETPWQCENTARSAAEKQRHSHSASDNDPEVVPKGVEKIYARAAKWRAAEAEQCETAELE